MGLDVYLVSTTPVKRKSTGVFFRENGKTIELTPEQVLDRWTDAKVKEVEHETTEVYADNITHNLNKMAEECGLYEPLWRPSVSKAKELITKLEKGIKKLKENPDKFKKFNPENGWGNYEGLLRFAENYLQACINNPETEIKVWR